MKQAAEIKHKETEIKEIELTGEQKELLYFLNEHKRLRKMKILKLSHMEQKKIEVKAILKQVKEEIKYHDKKIEFYAKILHKKRQ